jgi:sulfite exporter TauE/SafE
MNTLSTWESYAVVLALGLGTFLIRYSFIGLFTNHDYQPRYARMAC